MGIQKSKELNRTCCLNGGTCMQGSFCACPPSFYGCNCEHDSHKENCGSVPHARKCSMCKCWHGQLCCFPQSFLPGCDGHVMDEHLTASRTPELTLSACALMLPGICLAIQSYY
uniref:Cryptic/Cripto CFC domain-containing protein n=1 Tax=Capra hircus TaxID=9925 RepID=A0A8C2R324_CAPHI